MVVVAVLVVGAEGMRGGGEVMELELELELEEELAATAFTCS